MMTRSRCLTSEHVRTVLYDGSLTIQAKEPGFFPGLLDTALHFFIDMSRHEIKHKTNELNKTDHHVENKLVDLHVFIVPLELWIERYRTVYNNAVLESTSAGFIRVPCSTSLHVVRKLILQQLGQEIVPDEFIYLRSVGRCLAVVNKGQEQRLQAKDFAPPLAYSPELFLLPYTHEDALLGSLGAKQLYNSNQYYDSKDFTDSTNSSRDSSDVSLPVQHNKSLPYLKSSYDITRENSNNESNSDSEISILQMNKIKNQQQPVKIIKTQYTTPDLNSNESVQNNNNERLRSKSSMSSNPPIKHSHNLRSNSLSNVNLQLIQPELALLQTSSQSLFPLPSARVLHSQEDRLHEAGNEVSNEKNPGEEERSKISSDVVHGDSKRNGTREHKIHKRRSSMNKEKKKLIQDKMRETMIQSAESERDNREKQEHLQQFGSSDAGNNVRLISLEVKMKERYQKEQQRLANEESEDDVRTSEVKIKERNEKGRQHSVDVGSQVDIRNEKGKTKERNEKDRQRSIDEGSQIDIGNEKGKTKERNEKGQHRSIDEGSQIDIGNEKGARHRNEEERSRNSLNKEESKALESQNEENYDALNSNKNSLDIKHMNERNVRTPVEDDEELLSKIREIEEIKKMNIELRKKKQLDDDEKDKAAVDKFQTKKSKVDALKRQLEKVRAEKHNYQKEREHLVKKSRSLQAEVHSKHTQKNNTWRKKFVQERKRTAIIEEEIRKSKNNIEAQHRKLLSRAGPKAVPGKNKDLVLNNNGLPSERSNQKNMVLRLQNETEDLKLRIDGLISKLAAETKMREFAQQELKELRDKTVEVKINASRAKQTLSPPSNYLSI